MIFSKVFLTQVKHNKVALLSANIGEKTVIFCDLEHCVYLPMSYCFQIWEEFARLKGNEGGGRNAKQEAHQALQEVLRHVPGEYFA